MSRPDASALEARGKAIDTIVVVAAAVLGGVGAFRVAGIMPVVAIPDGISMFVWYAIRVSGIAAYIALWLTTMAGIAITGQIGTTRVPAAILYPLHQLGDLALSLAVLHGALLLGDRYAAFTPASLVIPFTASYRPFWTGLGILAFYAAAAVFWSVEVRPRIGYRAWRLIHYAAFAAFAFALLHGVFSGTDTSSPAMLLVYALTGASFVWLARVRMRTAVPPPAREPSRA